jgi:hypothetical protein
MRGRKEADRRRDARGPSGGGEATFAKVPVKWGGWRHSRSLLDVVDRCWQGTWSRHALGGVAAILRPSCADGRAGFPISSGGGQMCWLRRASHDLGRGCGRGRTLTRPSTVTRDGEGYSPDGHARTATSRTSGRPRRGPLVAAAAPPTAPCGDLQASLTAALHLRHFPQSFLHPAHCERERLMVEGALRAPAVIEGAAAPPGHDVFGGGRLVRLGASLRGGGGATGRVVRGPRRPADARLRGSGGPLRGGGKCAAVPHGAEALLLRVAGRPRDR